MTVSPGIDHRTFEDDRGSALVSSQIRPETELLKPITSMECRRSAHRCNDLADLAGRPGDIVLPWSFGGEHDLADVVSRW
jgi:hypothetical protein